MTAAFSSYMLTKEAKGQFITVKHAENQPHINQTYFTHQMKLLCWYMYKQASK